MVSLGKEVDVCFFPPLYPDPDDVGSFDELLGFETLDRNELYLDELFQNNMIRPQGLCQQPEICKYIFFDVLRVDAFHHYSLLLGCFLDSDENDASFSIQHPTHGLFELMLSLLVIGKAVVFVL